MRQGSVAVDDTELRLDNGRRLRATIPLAAVTRAISPTWQDRRPITRLALHVDDPAAFVSAPERPAPR